MRSRAATACRRRIRRSPATRSSRELSPYGLVVHAGRWYLAAYDHGRDDLRTFRVDRMRRTSMTLAAAAPPPEGFDAVEHVAHSLASVPWTWEVEVMLALPLADAAARLAPVLAELVALRESTVLRIRVDSLDWIGRRARRPRLRLRRRAAGGAARERSRPGGAPGSPGFLTNDRQGAHSARVSWRG